MVTDWPGVHLYQLHGHIGIYTTCVKYNYDMVLDWEVEVGRCILQPSLHCETCIPIQKWTNLLEGYWGKIRQVRSFPSSIRKLWLHLRHKIMCFTHFFIKRLNITIITEMLLWIATTWRIYAIDPLKSTNIFVIGQLKETPDPRICPIWEKDKLRKSAWTTIWFLMSCITTKRVFECYLKQGGTSDGVTGIEIGAPKKADNHLMKPTPGSIF